MVVECADDVVAEDGRYRSCSIATTLETSQRLRSGLKPPTPMNIPLKRGKGERHGDVRDNRSCGDVVDESEVGQLATWP